MNRLISFLGMFVFCSLAMAQEEDIVSYPEVVILTTENIELKGFLILENSETLTLKTNYGESIINKESIKSMSYLKDHSLTLNDQRYSSTHYFLAPSGYNLRKGQWYYENTLLVWNSYTVGLSDNFSLSLGGEGISLLVSEFPVLFVTPKLSFPFKEEGGAFSVSTTIFTSAYNDFTTFGFLQGAITLGSRKNNLTIGSGIGYGFSEGFQNGFVPIIISGMRQASKRISLVSENWFLSTFGETYGILSLGLRIHGLKNNNYLSIALVRTTEDQGSLLALPFFSGVVGLN